jgi:hypothetical protein
MIRSKIPIIARILSSPANYSHNHFQGNDTDAESGSILCGLGNTFTDQRWLGAGQGSRRLPMVADIVVFRANRNIFNCHVACGPQAVTVIVSLVEPELLGS